MKQFLSCVLTLLVSTAFALDPPEPILPKTKVIRPHAWYTEQSARWKERVEQTPLDAAGWLNYYAASRYAQASSNELNNISLQAEQIIGGSFEGKIIKALNDGYSRESLQLLVEAHKMQPENSASYGALVLFEEFNLNNSEREQFSKKLLQSGLVSQALLSYSYNVLMSIENGSVLFVEGDNTTLPLIILQDVMNVRKDVTVLNLDLMISDNYRNSKLKEAGLNSISIDDRNSTGRKQLLCSVLPEQNPERKFYYALTMGRENLSAIDNQLYVVGLASQLSKERLDNIPVIKDNLEKRFLMDYLLVDFNGENEFSAGKVFSSNYLVSMLLLNEHYIKTGEVAKSKQLEKVFTKIAHETGKTALVENFLSREREEWAPVVLIDIEIKKLEGDFKLVKGNIYAGERELTNLKYNLFLDYLSKHGPAELYEKSRPDLSQYDATSMAFFKGYHTYIDPATVLVKGRGKNPFNNYPVINISHEGALAYCDWLTEQYNGNPDRKFKKVKFRLPTLKEWQIAALGFPEFQSWDLEKNILRIAKPKNATDEISKGPEADYPFDDTILYPWYKSHNYKNKAQNRRNCWLGNFKVPENCKPCASPSVGMDGFSMMGPTGSYFPNGMGLYDVVGNVAEMIDEDGKACGGSWNQSPEDSTIKSVSTYKGPDSSVGFRVFMEVIEN